MTATTTIERTGEGPPPELEPRRRHSLQPRYLPYLLVLPALAFELLVHLVPMVVGVVNSFRRLDLYHLREWLAAPFSGGTNYRVALDLSGQAGVELMLSFAVTAAFAVGSVAISWLFGIFAATMLQSSFRGRGALRTIFLVPYALPVYAGVITWKFMFDRDNGMVNAVLQDLGLTDGGTFWLLGGNSFVAMLAVSVWRLWPFALLTLMAGMQSIPNDVYEAAAVDGASRWRQFRSLTLPMLRPINLVLVLVLFLWSFNDFTIPYVLFGGSVPTPANLISIQIYDSSFLTWNFGLGSAMSVLLLLFLLVVTLAYLGFTSRRSRRA
jgi:multiple sugar transport system permease protein